MQILMRCLPRQFVWTALCDPKTGSVQPIFMIGVDGQGIRGRGGTLGPLSFLHAMSLEVKRVIKLAFFSASVSAVLFQFLEK